MKKRMILPGLLAMMTIGLGSCTFLIEEDISTISSSSEKEEVDTEPTYLPVTPIEPVRGEVPEETEKHYVTFLDDEGTFLERIEVEDGKEALYPGTVPNRADEENLYVFSSWDKDLSHVEEDMTVHAIYDIVPFDGDWAFQVNQNGDYLVASYRGEEKAVSIPSNYRGQAVSGVGSNAFYGNTTITSVIVPETILAIGADAFGYCTNLSEVHLPTSLLGISNNAFEYCLALTEIDLPSNLTTIGNQAFQYCQSLERIVLPDAVVQIGSQVYMGCIAVDSIQIGAGLKFIGSAPFYGTMACSSLTVSADNTYFSTDGIGLYYRIDESVLEGESLTTYRYNGILYIRGTNEEMTEYEVQEGTETLGTYYAAYVQGIERIIVPSSVTTDEGFGYVGSGIQEVFYPLDGNIQFGNGIFSNATSLTAFQLPRSLHYIPMWAFENTTSLTEVVLPEGILGLAEESFLKSGITKITLPSSLRFLCEERDDVDSQLDASAFVFSECVNLKEIVFSSDCKIEVLPNYFATANGLESFTFPESVKHVGDAPFQNCTSLKKVVMNDTLESMGNQLFEGCTGLEEVRITRSENITQLKRRFCWGCTSLPEIEIPENITQIGVQAFYNCTSLKRIYLPEGLESVGSNGFTNCPLTDIYYGGTEEQFAPIREDIEAYCDLGDVTIHYEANGLGE